jgi:TatD DNase family protein
MSGLVRYADVNTHLDLSLGEEERPTARPTLIQVAPLVSAAAQAGVTTIIQTGRDVGSSLWAVAAAAAFPTVWAAVGFHPFQAAGANEDALAAIAALTAHPRVAAVGEIGLDYRGSVPPEMQREVFVWHLELADEAALPVIVHAHQAEEDALALLAEHARDVTVVLHGFSMPDCLDEVVSRGYYVSFAGDVTYHELPALREAARQVPADLLLVETDAPRMAPMSERDRVNSPAQVVGTYESLADLRDVPLEELAARVELNVRRAFPRVGALCT